MERSFKILFDLSINHDFYTNKKSNDFLFLPTTQTRKNLSRFKCISRTKQAFAGQSEAHGLVVLYTEQNGAPLIPINASSNLSLVFGLQLHNSRFWNFTSEVQSLASDEVFHFTNVDASTVPSVIPLVRSKLKIKRKVFPYNFRLDGPYPKIATIKILDVADVEQTEYEQSIKSDDGDFQVLIDLNGLPDGIYKVQVEESAVIVKTDTYYINDELAMAGVFGVLDLQFSNNTDLSAKTLEIKFTPRNEKWKYFMAFKTPLEGGDTIVVGQTPVDGIKFSEITAVQLATPGRKADLSTKKSLQGQFPSAEIRLYESNNTILFNEVVEKNIKLVKNTNTLIAHLPGPSLDSPKAESYIFI